MCPDPPEPRSADQFAIRLGFAYVRGLGPAARAACDDAVVAGANTSIEDFWRFTLLPRAAMENLVKIGAFDAVSGGLHRRQQLWHLKRIEESLPSRRRKTATADASAPSKAPPSVGPPRGSGAIAGARYGDAPHVARDPSGDAPQPLLELPAPPPELRDMDERTRVTTEYALTQVSTGPHLVSFIRAQLDALGCMRLATARAAADGSRVRVAGLVITRQAPMSASGFRFFTLSDEDAHLDLVFRPDVAQRTRDASRHPLLMVDGTLQVERGRINVVVQQVTALDRNGEPLPPDAPLTTIPAPRPHNFR